MMHVECTSRSMSLNRTGETEMWCRPRDAPDGATPSAERWSPATARTHRLRSDRRSPTKTLEKRWDLVVEHPF